jgi:hypothetical protein
MADTTNYSLTLHDLNNYVVNTWAQKVAYLLSSVLGNLVKSGNGGVLSGWTLNVDKTVAAGEGVLGGTVPKTTTTQAITSLTNGALNYIYAQIDATSHDDTRTVDFIASLSSSNPAGTLRLGTMTLDGGGTVTARDDNPSGYRRDYWRGRRTRKITGTWTNALEIPFGATGMDDVDHSTGADALTFTGPSEIRITDVDEGWYAWAQPTGGGTFRLFVINNWVAGYDYDYYAGSPNWVQVTWEREGYV